MTPNSQNLPHPASFRDPSGSIFLHDGILYRRVNSCYRENYDFLMGSGLYRSLNNAGLLIPHEEVPLETANDRTSYKIIKPELIPFISYPYEWCFSQLKDAALVTLTIQKQALKYGMTLKDSSAYNIQFSQGKPILIDTLSFEKLPEGRPWIAYRQFCQHFLAPLALASYRDMRLQQLLRVYIDGIPLDLAGALLPQRTRFKPALLSHIHLHAKSQRYFSDKVVNTGRISTNRFALYGLIDSLEGAIRSLKGKPACEAWATYYKDTNYSPNAFNFKKETVSAFLDRIQPSCLWDMGANTGVFSRLAADKKIRVIAFDADCAAVEKNYRSVVANQETQILPLILDLTNPSAGIGWENQERMTIFERGPADAVLALALIHHLTFNNNLSFKHSANFFSRVATNLIIEFIPKNDSQVQRMLAGKTDIFPDYTKERFEAAFLEYFTLQDSSVIRDSQRILYRMRKK